MEETSFRLFETKLVSDLYARGRPTYNDKIAQHIVGSIGSKMKDEKHELMVEVGCGSGQATNVLAPYFHNVHATDISESQIAQAKTLSKFDHINYKVGCAEEIYAEDASADLLVAAEAAHWFDLNKFFSEVRRVLKPKGCLAVIGYVHPKMTPRTSTGFQRQLTEELSKVLDRSIIDNITKKLVPNYLDIQNNYSQIFKAIPSKQKSRKVIHRLYENWQLNHFTDLINTIIIQKNDANLKSTDDVSPRESENEYENVFSDFVCSVNDILENNGVSPESVISYEADFEMTVITASDVV